MGVRQCGMLVDTKYGGKAVLDLIHTEYGGKAMWDVSPYKVVVIGQCGILNHMNYGSKAVWNVSSCKV